MEMNEQQQEDWLDAKLREEAPYIDDAGFTAAVMANLPAARPARSLRPWIITAMTLIGCAVALFLSAESLGENLAFLIAMPLWTIFAMGGSVALLIMVLGTAAAMRRVGNRRL